MHNDEVRSNHGGGLSESMVMLLLMVSIVVEGNPRNWYWWQYQTVEGEEG